MNGTSTLTGAVAVGGPLSVGTGGVSTSGSLVTGSATTPGGAVFGYDGSAVRAPNFPRGLESQGTVTVTQGATGGVPGLVVTNGGIGGNPVRRVEIYNDQANPGTLISMTNGATGGTIAYTGTAFQLSQPLTIPVQAGSSGNLTVGGSITTGGGFLYSGYQTLNWNLGNAGQAPLSITSSMFRVNLSNGPGPSNDPFYVADSNGGYSLVNGGIRLTNPTWNQYTAVFALLGQAPTKVIPAFPIGIYGYCNGGVTVSYDTDPTVRTCQIFGQGLLPADNVRIESSGSSNSITFIVFQGVP